MPALRMHLERIGQLKDSLQEISELPVLFGKNIKHLKDLEAVLQSELGEQPFSSEGEYHRWSQIGSLEWKLRQSGEAKPMEHEYRRCLESGDIESVLRQIGETDCANFVKWLSKKPPDPLETLNFHKGEDMMKIILFYISSNPLVKAHLFKQHWSCVPHFDLSEFAEMMRHSIITNIAKEVTKKNLAAFIGEYESYKASLRSGKAERKSTFDLKTCLFKKNIMLLAEMVDEIFPDLKWLVNRDL
jgi:hypothetical protein